MHAEKPIVTYTTAAECDAARQVMNIENSTVTDSSRKERHARETLKTHNVMDYSRTLKPEPSTLKSKP